MIKQWKKAYEYPPFPGGQPFSSRLSMSDIQFDKGAVLTLVTASFAQFPMVLKRWVWLWVRSAKPHFFSTP